MIKLLKTMDRKEERSVDANQVALCYPDGEATEYALECLIPAINDELPDYAVSCSIQSEHIRALIKNPSSPPQSSHHSVAAIHWSDYDLIDWSLLKSFPRNTLFAAYPIRKALIRKNYLIKAVESYHAKNKSQTPSKEEGIEDHLMIPKSYTFNLTYSDELDELWMDELYELKCEFEIEEDKNEEDERNLKIWILKPAMADKGQGIRLFRNRQELYDIFNEFERMEDLLIDQEAQQHTPTSHSNEAEEPSHQDEINRQHTWVSISQMREWIIQEYISNPLLIDPDNLSTYSKDTSIDRSGFHKHHLRVYVLAVGALNVYVFEDMLSLLSSEVYSKSDIRDLRKHLTNTSLQQRAQPQQQGQNETKFNTIRSIPKHPEIITKQIDEIVENLFKFIATNDPINFQLFLNCFEIFGLDFLIDDHFKVWLLEINSGPDFSQTGDELKPIIKKLYKDTIKVLKSNFSFINKNNKNDNDKKEEEDGDKSSGNFIIDNQSNLKTSNNMIGGFRSVLNLQTNLSFL